MYYELIYETGAKSVACYDTEAEMLNAVANHHTRATQGEDGGPYGGPAERVVKVLAYDEHPGELNMSQMMDAAEVKKVMNKKLDDLSMGGQVSVTELAAAVRDMTNPLVEAAGRHDSQYKMKETKEYTPADWEGAAA